MGITRLRGLFSVAVIVSISAGCALRGKPEPMFSVAATKHCLKRSGHVVRGPYHFKDVPGRTDIIYQGVELSFFTTLAAAHEYSQHGSEPARRHGNVVFNFYTSGPISPRVRSVEACLRRS